VVGLTGSCSSSDRGSSGPNQKSSLINDVSLAPWLGSLVVALLLLRLADLVVVPEQVSSPRIANASRRSATILARTAAVTNDLVVVPVGRELSDYEHYRTELAAPATASHPPGRAAYPPTPGGHRC